MKRNYTLATLFLIQQGDIYGFSNKLKDKEIDIITMKAEYQLIIEKKSTLSKSERDKIIIAYEGIIQNS